MDRWYRPLLPIERGLYKEFTLTYWMEISAPTAINLQQFESALLQLLRMSEILRICIKERDGELWFSDMEEEKIDFKLFKKSGKKDVKKAIEEPLLNFTHGPLWRSFILDHEDPENKYTVFLFYNHAIIDASTCVKLQRMFLESLENQLFGERHKIEELGKLIYGTQVSEILSEVEEQLMKDSSLRNESWSSFQKVVTIDPEMRRLFTEGSSDGELSFEMMEDFLSEDDTNLLIKRCKENCVTVNSALTGAINFAFIIILQELGVKKRCYKTSVNHYVSFRRHMKNGKEALGCIVGNLVDGENLSLDEHGSFSWSYVKKLHADLYPKITGRQMLHQSALKNLGKSEYGTSDKEEEPFFLYHVSNIGKIDFGEENKIKVLNFSRQCRPGLDSPSAVSPAFICYTYKRKLFVKCEYIPAYTKGPLVRSLLTQMLSLLRNSVR